MIFQLEYVYCKSDLHWQRESGHNSRAVLHRKTHQAHINSRHGNVPYQSQESEKGGQADNRFLKRRCYDNRVIHHTAASRGGPENPRTTRVKRFPTGNRLTVGAIHPQIRFRGPFFPASSREKRARERNHDGSATI